MSTLYRKYRPKAWAEVAGQNHVKVTLGFEIASGKIAHAYLFSGPRGVGKTTTARIFSRAVNCPVRAERAKSDLRGTGAGEPCGECEPCTAILENRSLDVIEIDAASHRGIDAVRDNIIENARFSPSQLKYKVFIIDEVHMLTTEAFNALLKTLEEPPAHAVFILATTELHKVPATIVSRCQRFDFRKIPFTDMVERLNALAAREKVKVDRRTLEEIARQADGSLRDAEGLLGKVLTVGDGKRVTYDEALLVLPRSDAQAIAGFVDALLHRDARTAIMLIGDCLEGGVDLDQFATDTIELLRRTLLAKMSGNPDVFSLEMDEESKKKLVEWAGLATMPELVLATETLMEKRREIRAAHPPQLPLELAVIRICEGMTKGVEGSRGGEVEKVGGSSGSGQVVKREVESAASVPVAPVASKRVEKPAVVSSNSAQHVLDALDVAAAAPSKSPTAVPVPAGGTAKGSRASAQGVPQDDRALTREERGQAPPPPETVTEASGTAVSTVERIKSVWADFMSKAGDLNGGLPFLLGVGTPTEVSGKIVRIGFDFAFHKDKLNQEKNRRMLETALGGILGADIRVEGVLLEKKPELGHDDAAPKAVPAMAGTGFDGNILQAFGGRVVE